MFVNGKHLLKGDTPMLTIYELYKDDDGLLYIFYNEETTLG